MMKLEAIINFTLERYDELKNIERISIETKGRLYPGDRFECNEDLGKYLLGENDRKLVVAKLIEIIPEKVKPFEAKLNDTNKVSVKPIKKRTSKKIK